MEQLVSGSRYYNSENSININECSSLISYLANNSITNNVVCQERWKERKKMEILKSHTQAPNGNSLINYCYFFNKYN